MILRYELPQQAKDLIKLSDDERIYYAVPIDIDDDGSWCNDSYLVVTTLKVHVISGEKIRSFEIKELNKATAQAGVGNGILVVDHNGTERILANYSAKHLSRYAYVARGINILISGRFEEVESNEYEKICPKCGSAGHVQDSRVTRAGTIMRRRICALTMRSYTSSTCCSRDSASGMRSNVSFSKSHPDEKAAFPPKSFIANFFSFHSF